MELETRNKKSFHKRPDWHLSLEQPSISIVNDLPQFMQAHRKCEQIPSQGRSHVQKNISLSASSYQFLDCN